MRLPNPLPLRVVGVSFVANYPENLLQIHDNLQTGNFRGKYELSLIREPDNPHDSNAIRVLVNGKPVGHIPANLAKPLAKRIDAGKRYRGWVDEVLIDPEHPERPGLAVILARET